MIGLGLNAKRVAEKLAGERITERPEAIGQGQFKQQDQDPDASTLGYAGHRQFCGQASQRLARRVLGA